MKFNNELNHSAAHVMAASLKKLYPNIKLTLGPAIDEGFYYDFYSDEPISINDLPKIEKQMKKIISGAYEFKKEEKTKKEALEFFSDNKYKCEIINSIPDNEIISFYTNGDFTDLCRGPHVSNTNKIKAFKLLNVAGSYWRGDSKNDQLTRIYGVAFESEEELKEYLELLEERKQRDHRKIGKDLKLFTFSNLVGQGLPIWLPNGTKIKYEIQKYINKLQNKYEFLPVMTPVLGTVDLYKTSGHWDHYKENMFPVMDVDGELLVLRPMTCPHHIIIYKNDIHSYRQLPIRLCEHSNLHRYESSGGLTGLERVREMVLEDTHIFCRPDQIKQEVNNCYKAIMDAHEGLGTKIWRVDLSIWNPNDKEKFHGNVEMWENSQQQLKQALDDNNIEYTVMTGEAAFYGPKIDFQVKTALGHIVTVSTIQLDFLLPERFELEYVTENGTTETPVMVHLGIIGTYERYLAMLLEQTKGALPLWLSPTQIQILPVNPSIHGEYANKLNNEFLQLGYRSEVDGRDERLAKRIREAQISKIPYQLIIGDEEVNSGNLITFRCYGEQEDKKCTLSEFKKILSDRIESKK
ncbi:MAG: threonine--tRNA ligase [Candidatus Ureaplasma intestinipullorum]|uniref:Threonine--tRNA ligase n=1 Tax=Candidatus Ureaplasma intestinipullorum TaxID=2838770 RepID=A0A9E2KW97_9BACT|nr:threonine--tRNA ligase [Candidatus Ureaplasma intestinipullorum]